MYFSSLTGKIYCIDATTFAQVWVTDLRNPDPAHNQPVDNTDPPVACWSSPLVVNGKVYVGVGLGEADAALGYPFPAAFGFVYCLDASNGHVNWLFCTNKFSDVQHNSPNDIPPSLLRYLEGAAPPLPFTRHQSDPPFRGASVWSSCAYDPVRNLIYVGTGNPLPDHPLPEANRNAPDSTPLSDPYSCGMLALDADSGQLHGFFQPFASDSYRELLDLDVDMPSSPTVYRPNFNARYVVGIGSKNGSFFLLDPDNIHPQTGRIYRLASRQLLPYQNGQPVPGLDDDKVDPQTHQPRATGNDWGVFGSAGVDLAGRLFVGLGGDDRHIDTPTTPFVRALDWNTLADRWPTFLSTRGVSLYSTPFQQRGNPIYSNFGEVGLSSPAVVNDVVFVSTSRPGLYAFDHASGSILWHAENLGDVTDETHILGPAISGEVVAIGAGNTIHTYSLVSKDAKDNKEQKDAKDDKTEKPELKELRDKVGRETGGHITRAIPAAGDTSDMGDPNAMLHQLAERVENLERFLATRQAFIQPGERPEVGAQALEEAEPEEG